MNKMNISFIIPVYNGEKFIKAIIESILLQLNDNDEIVVVNDGSTDNTKSILLSNNWANVKVINQKNKGVSAARNKGLEFATRDIVIFFDCDDSIDNNVVEKVRSVFVKNISVNWCFGYYKINNLNGVITIKHDVASEGVYNSVFDLYRTFSLSMTNELLSTCALFFRRDIFNIYGGFDESMISGEDTYAWLKFGLNNPKIYYLNSNVFTYNRGSNKMERATHFRRSRNELLRISKAIRLIESFGGASKSSLHVVKTWFYRHIKLSIIRLEFKNIIILIKIYFSILKVSFFK